MNLFEKFCSYENLLGAWDEIAEGRSTNKSFIKMQLYKNEILTSLQQALINGKYRPGKVFRFVIYEPKKRNITAPKLIDRLVHHAVMRVALAHFERYYHQGCYANRKYRGNLSACQHYAELMRKALGKYGNTFYIISIDARKFFETIDHDVIKRLLIRLFRKDLSLIPMFYLIIDSIENGLPLGFLTSQHLANLLGSYIDYFVTDCHGYPYEIRYADDIRIFVHTYTEAKELLYEIDSFAHTKLAIALSDKKTKIKRFRGADLFCGYNVHPHSLSPKHATVKRGNKRTNKRIKLFEQGAIDESKIAESEQALNGYLTHCKALENKTQIKRRINSVLTEYDNKQQSLASTT